MAMKVLVIGKGGREHALVWKLAQSKEVTKLYAAPGNPGIAEHAELVPIPVDQHADLLRFARDNAIDLTVVGPEDPLAAGIADRFEQAGLRLFGPKSRAARLEGSKVFAKEFMRKYGIPCGTSRSFHDYDLANQHLKGLQPPIVVKADGLAAGKGVKVCLSIPEAQDFVRKLMRENHFGEAGKAVVFEEFLEGQEQSILAISDGHTIIPFEPTQDHKPIFDGNKGANTGGMGTYSPIPGFSQERMEEIEREVLVQAIHGLNREESSFQGCLFAGLISDEEESKVLEFNVRFGDPETQTVLRRLRSDLFPLFWHACEGTLDQVEVEWDPRSVVSVVLASSGYPEKSSSPVPIFGLDKDFGEDVVVFHAGTKLQAQQLYTAGGRVLCVSAIADDLQQARTKAYEVVEQIEFAGKQYRTDIAATPLSEELSPSPE